MGVIKKMGTIGSKMGRKFEQKRKAKWVKKKKIWSRPNAMAGACICWESTFAKLLIEF